MKKKWSMKYKLGLVACIAVIVVLAAFVVMPRLLVKDTSTNVATVYSVDQVSYGSVSRSISGSGNLEARTQSTLSADEDCEVTKVKKSSGEVVSSGDVIAVLTNDDGDTEKITAPFDGVITELYVKKGDDVSADGEVAQVMAKSGYDMEISINESDIGLVSIGQTVLFDIDSVKDEYEGSVTEISYDATTDGGATVFSAVVTVGYIEGVYPGMNATAEITVDKSAEGLTVPVSAVCYDDDDETFVYLAPDGASLALEFTSDELNLEECTKVPVTAGISNGMTISVTSDELGEGDLILVITAISDATESESEDEDDESMTMGGMGAMGATGREDLGSGGDRDSGQRSDFNQGGSNSSGGAVPSGSAPSGSGSGGSATGGSASGSTSSQGS